LALLFLIAPETITVGYAGREFSLSERLLTQTRMLWHYVGWLVIPNIMDMGFQHDDIPLSRSLWQPLTTGLSLLAWCALLISTLIWRKRYPFLLFATLFFIVAHFMESTVLALEMVYEHRNYLPSVGISIILAIALFKAVCLTPKLRLGVAAGGVLLVLATLLFVRTQTWSDELVLARFNVANHPDSSRSNFFYARALFDRFQSRRELNLDDEEARALAVVSRQYFEKMHEIDGRDVAPMVMLYQIDSMLFPGMRDGVDWLETLDELLHTRTLQASDYTALMALVEYFGHYPADSDRDRLSAMLDTLIERHPGRANLLILKYKHMASSDNFSDEQLLAVLEQTIVAAPGYLEAYPYLMMQHDKVADAGAVHEAARDWMLHDSSRRELSVLRQVFADQ
jgi:hypothetical protein